MQRIVRLATYPLTSERFDSSVGRAVCFMGAICALILAAWNFARIEMSEGLLIVGVLAALACSLQLVMLGMLLPLGWKRQNVT